VPTCPAPQVCAHPHIYPHLGSLVAASEPFARFLSTVARAVPTSTSAQVPLNSSHVHPLPAFTSLSSVSVSAPHYLDFVFGFLTIPRFPIDTNMATPISLNLSHIHTSLAFFPLSTPSVSAPHHLIFFGFLTTHKLPINATMAACTNSRPPSSQAHPHALSQVIAAIPQIPLPCMTTLPL